MAKTTQPTTEAAGTEPKAGSPKRTARKKASRKRAMRKAAPTKSGAKKASTKKASAKRGPGKRYTKAEKTRIMTAAKKGNMTGAEAAKQFGISTLTFYRWRGPVRGKRVAAKRGPGRPKGSGRVEVDESAVRQAVQAQLRKMLPRIIQEEVMAALGRLK